MDAERFGRKRDDKEGSMKGGRIIPMLPLRDIVIFPHMVVNLLVGRKRSVTAQEEALNEFESNIRKDFARIWIRLNGATKISC